MHASSFYYGISVAVHQLLGPLHRIIFPLRTRIYVCFPPAEKLLLLGVFVGHATTLFPACLVRALSLRRRALPLEA